MELTPSIPAPPRSLSLSAWLRLPLLAHCSPPIPPSRRSSPVLGNNADVSAKNYAFSRCHWNLLFRVNFSHVAFPPRPLIRNCKKPRLFQIRSGYNVTFSRRYIAGKTIKSAKLLRKNFLSSPKAACSRSGVKYRRSRSFLSRNNNFLMIERSLALLPYVSRSTFEKYRVEKISRARVSIYHASLIRNNEAAIFTLATRYLDVTPASPARISCEKIYLRSLAGRLARRMRALRIISPEMFITTVPRERLITDHAILLTNSGMILSSRQLNFIYFGCTDTFFSLSDPRGQLFIPGRS